VRSHATVVAIAAAFSMLCGCSPGPESGTNTNWACRVEADCKDHAGTTCQDGFCAKGPASAEHVGDGQPIVGSLFQVVATDSGFITVGYQPLPGGDQSLAASSSNGRDWTAIAVEGNQLGSVKFGNGIVVVEASLPDKTGFLVGPPNGPWQFQRRDNNIGPLLFGNGLFFTTPVDAGGNYVSADGVHWSWGTGTSSGPYCFADGHFFAWDIVPPPPGILRFAARTSTDGVTWSDQKPLSSNLLPTAASAVGNEILVLGRTGSCGTDFCSPEMLSLPRGTDPWAPTAETAPWADPRLFPKAIVATDARVVVVTSAEDDSSPQIWTTALPRSSASWQSVEMPADWHIFDLTYGAGVFVVVGARGQELNVTALIATSTDGLNWQEASISQ
jgi:hypothetical protein